MHDKLRFDIAEHPLAYVGNEPLRPFDRAKIAELNHSHEVVLRRFGLQLVDGAAIILADRLNHHSNLGGLRNRQLRESVILSAALAAVAVALSGRGALLKVPHEQASKMLLNKLKRANDRSAAQVMSEVLQLTTETLPIGEEVLIESAITEGVRAKPGNELGGNPTIPVGALFGKASHRAHYGQPMPRCVSLLSMGSDVIDGTTKSVKGEHSSFTSLFVTEANVKRHLPDVYVQRWMAGAPFPRFNPRETDIREIAQIIAAAYGERRLDGLSAFFLERSRHHVPMRTLNELGIRTPSDQDGDLMPAVVLGLDSLRFPDQGPLSAMIGEIGGSAEWAVAVLPLVWRGGHALGMFTSQSALTRKGVSAEELWNHRYHFTEDEFIVMQDARFERKPYFTVEDILDDPYAGGVSAFGAITDNLYVPFLRGVRIDPQRSTVTVNVLIVDSMGQTQCWRLEMRCPDGLDAVRQLMASPKNELEGLRGVALEQAIGRQLDSAALRQRYRLFFNNEYYPALVPVHDKMVVLHRVIDGLLGRGAIEPFDEEVVRITERLAGGAWFIHSDG